MTHAPDRLLAALLTDRMRAPGSPQELSDTAISANASQIKKRFMAASMRRPANESSGGSASAPCAHLIPQAIPT
jgi:hypothetical protein